jgi:hypothetical protein
MTCRQLARALASTRAFFLELKRRCGAYSVTREVFCPGDCIVNFGGLFRIRRAVDVRNATSMQMLVAFGVQIKELSLEGLAHLTDSGTSSLS